MLKKILVYIVPVFIISCSVAPKEATFTSEAGKDVVCHNADEVKSYYYTYPWYDCVWEDAVFKGYRGRVRLTFKSENKFTYYTLYSYEVK